MRSSPGSRNAGRRSSIPPNKAEKRDAVLVVDIAQPADLPSIAGPWSLMSNAECEFRLAMRPEHLQQAGLDALGAKWTQRRAR
ncbi:hypothetical protein B0G84_7014 [Paraburkholderia sp. BL8N3]|nr:hypothetical protein B0G84_7014 [Paraburkholderia sp. BL8N3]